MKPCFYGLILGILVCGLALAVIITLWLISPSQSAKITTGKLRELCPMLNLFSQLKLIRFYTILYRIKIVLSKSSTRLTSGLEIPGLEFLRFSVVNIYK